MALEYFLYTTLYNNTLVDRSDTTFVPLPPNTGQILIDYFIPTIQPLYYYRESVATIVLNDEATIDAYLTGTAPPPQGEDDVIQSQFTGYTATTNTQIVGIENNISYLSGQTDTKLPITNFNSFTGTTLPANYYNKTEINIYTGVTDTRLNGIDNEITYLSGQTDTKLNITNFNSFTGTTLPANYYNKTQINAYSASTLSNINSRLLSSVFNSFTGTTLPSNYYNKTQINIYTGATAIAIGLKLDKTTFNSFTGTTLPLNYYNKTQINAYSASTLTNINSRLLKTDFNSFTGTTLPTNYYNKTQINSYTGVTATAIGNKVDKVGAAMVTDIATFVSGGNIQDSGKQFITTVNPVGSATDTKVATELAVRTAINQAISGAIILQGDWNASTNTPDLTVTGITTGFAWRVSVSGTTNLGGITSWAIGDMAVKSATGWVKIDNEDISAVWGNIYGTLSDQTDLQLALNAKQNTITGAATSITTANLTINRALVSDASGKVAVSTITSTQLGYLSGTTSNIQAQINLKAPITSPTFLVSANAPTPVANNNSTCIATTAWYFGQCGTSVPLMNGNATVGTSQLWAHQDHVHPRDTTKLSLSGGTMTGTLNGTIMCASTCMCSPIVCATTRAQSPIVCGGTCVTSPITCATTRMQSPIVCATSCVRSPLVSGSTLCASISAFAPTPAVDNNSTCIATTAFIAGQASSVLPVANCIAGATGTSLRYSRQDHRHPINTANNAVVFTRNNVLSGNTAFIYTGTTLSVPKVRYTAPSTGGTLSDYNVVWNPVTKEVRTIPISGGTSAVYCYADNRVVGNNATEVNATYLTRTWSLPAGYYEFEYGAIFGNDTSNRCAIICFLFDGAVVGSCNLMKTNDTNVRVAAYITQNNTVTAASHSASMVYRQCGGGTASVYTGTIRIQKIGD